MLVLRHKHCVDLLRAGSYVPSRHLPVLRSTVAKDGPVLRSCAADDGPVLHSLSGKG